MRDNTGWEIPDIEGNSEDRNSELVNTYPIFEEGELDGETVYVEKSLYANIPEGKDRFRDEDARFFLLPSGAVLLSSASLVHSEDLWNISHKDEVVLRKLEEFVQEHKEERKPALFQMGNQRNYKAEVFSYDDSTSTKRLNDILEDKMRKRRANSK